MEKFYILTSALRSGDGTSDVQHPDDILEITLAVSDSRNIVGSGSSATFYGFRTASHLRQFLSKEGVQQQEAFIFFSYQQMNPMRGYSRTKYMYTCLHGISNSTTRNCLISPKAWRCGAMLKAREKNIDGVENLRVQSAGNGHRLQPMPGI